MSLSLTGDNVLLLLGVAMHVSGLTGVPFAPRIVSDGVRDEDMIVGACTDFLRDVASSCSALETLHSKNPELAEWLRAMPSETS